MKRILLFKIEEIAYQSTGVFMDLLAKELENLGAQVDFFDIKEQSVEQMEELIHSSYDAMIDFNSKLPRMLKDEEGYFLDCIDAPFFHFILDHPVYHHASLSCKLANYHVICLDRTHEAYIRTYYPHIRNVITHPLGGISLGSLCHAGYSLNQEQIQQKSWENRSHELLFSGSYLNPEDYEMIIDNLPNTMRTDIHEVVDLLMSHTDMTFEEAVLVQMRGKRIETPIAVRAQMMFLADIYVRAYFRKQITEKVAKSGIQFTVCGEKYEESGLLEYPNVTILPQTTYAQNIEMIADSRCVLNIMPWFKDGIHDRILNAMANGAVSITDSSRMLQEHFIPQKDYLQYSIDDPDSLIQTIQQIVDHGKLEEIAYNGMQKAESISFSTTAKRIYEAI